MKLEDFDHGERFQARVKSSNRLTPQDSTEVRELVLELETKFQAEAGQSVGVIVHGPHAMGQRHHFRMYSLAGAPLQNAAGKAEIHLCVRRCNYIDPYSGEECRGIASNYLCDLEPGDVVDMNGPFGIPFEPPADPAADLLLFSIGTGIAPFRAFVDKLYREQPDRSGRVWLFHGANSGLELLYMNDERDDFAEYYDRETFQAFKALSPRPNWADPIVWDYSLEFRMEEIWKLLLRESTYVFLAGQSSLRENLDTWFAGMADSECAWQEQKQELMDNGRWTELLY